MITPLTLPDFDTDDISYGFFGRGGGVSAGIYASLNCRNGSDDDLAAVAENRLLVAEIIGAGTLNNVYQVHGSDVVVLTRDLEERPEADALVTDQPGIAIGVLTADCTPVLFYGEKADGAPVVAAAHAGWKGAFGSVLNNTVQEMVLLGVQLKTVHAAIGPTIAQESYEVDMAFYQRFIAQDAGHSMFFVPSLKTGHYMFDLPGYCALRLRGCGVDHITMSGVDTYSRPQDYFSYRRTTHAGENDYGGQISAIMIKNT